MMVDSISWSIRVRMGTNPAIVSSAPTGVVLNAPVIQRAALVWVNCSSFAIPLVQFHDGFHHSWAPYVSIGSTLEM
jgi:hypothetical protein